MLSQSENLEEIAKRGESETIEFKEDYTQEHILRTMVGFASTRGGIILLGVNDNSEVKGFREDMDDVQRSITNSVSSNCDPPIHWSLVKTEIRGLPILFVRVPEGENKPYVLEDQGIYVRRGSTTRRISRRELDEIYRRRSQGLSTLGSVQLTQTSIL